MESWPLLELVRPLGGSKLTPEGPLETWAPATAFPLLSFTCTTHGWAKNCASRSDLFASAHLTIADPNAVGAGPAAETDLVNIRKTRSKRQAKNNDCQ